MKNIFNKRALIGSVAAVTLLLPVMASAQGFATLGGVIDSFTSTVVKALGSLFIASGVVAFFYGMVNFIWAVRDGDAAKVKTGRIFMVWGLIGVFVMVSVWGIVGYFQGIFGIQASSNVVMPTIGGGAGGGGTAFGAAGGSAGTAFGGGGGGTAAGGGGLFGGLFGGGAAGGGAAAGGGGAAAGGGGGFSSAGAPCSGPSDCPGLTCVNFTCQAPTGGDCAANSDCNAGQVCISNICRLSGGGGSSAPAGYSCSPGFECTLSTGGIGICNSAGNGCDSNSIGSSPSGSGNTIIGGDCAATADCGAGEECIANKCTVVIQ